MASGCTDWDTAVACPAGETCSGGKCGQGCTDQCTDGETRCSASGAGVQICKKMPSGCTDWDAAVACPAGQTCSGGKCSAGCADQCQKDATQCSGDQVQVCEVMSDGCTDWGQAQDCPQYQTCSNDACNSCYKCFTGDKQCNGNAVETCQLKASSGCYYWDTPAPCTAGSVCAAGYCVKPHAIVITEMLLNPDSSSDLKGEWFEIFNSGTTAVDMTGWTLQDGSGSSLGVHYISATYGTIVIQPGQYLVLGQIKDTTVNGGVTLDYVYGTGFFMANDEDEIILKDDKGEVVDAVGYNTSNGWSIPTGASLSLKDVALDNNDPKSWCVETGAWSGSAGDKGTPGQKASCK
jgi:hypothetical protein